MAYGEIKVDTVTFTDGGIDKSVSISGLVQNPTFSGNITVTGTISGNTVQGQTVSGVTVTGTTANFVSGVFTTQISGATITGNVGSFTTITGGTVTLTSGVFASGTAAAPSVSIGTTDNGLYSPGADQVAVATSGTGRLFVDASGNVGVGTSSVNALLEVNNSTAGGEVQRIEGNYDGSGSVTLTNWRRAGGSVAAALKYNDDSSPLCMSIGTTTSHEFRIRTADTDAITIDASQRVGIGTSSPNVPLDIESSAGTAVKIRLASNTSNRALAFSNAAETIGWTVGNGVIASARQFVVYDNEAGAARLLIDSSGNVGIGTTTPNTSLHISSPDNTTAGTLRVADTDGRSLLFESPFLGAASANIKVDGSGLPLAFYTDGSERLRIDGSGRLLVGATTAFTTEKVKIKQSSNTRYHGLWIENSADDSGLAIGYDTASDCCAFSPSYGSTGSYKGLAFYTSNVERARITSAGLVGIGTSSPSELLTVAGNARFDKANSDLFIKIGGTSRGGNTYSNYIDLDNNGFGAPGAFQTASKGDKIILWGGSSNDAEARIGFSLDDSVWVKTMGTAVPNAFAVHGAAANSGSPNRLFTITKTGLVGIGTASPGSRLEIGGNSSYDAKVTFNRVPVQASNDAVIGELFFQNNADSVALIAVKRESAADDAYIQFATQQTTGGLSERVRITSAGRVGIGTSSPNRTLHVYGDQAFSNSNNTGTLLFAPAASANYIYSRAADNSITAVPLGIAMGSTDAVRIDTSGRVGIGSSTFSLDSRLKVKQSSGLYSYNGLWVERLSDESGIGLGYDTASDCFALTTTYGSTGAYKGLAFSTGGSEKARIDSSGRLGIGTSSPSYLIDASGTASSGIRYKSTGLYGGVIADNTNPTGGGFFAALQNGVQKAIFGVVGAFAATTNADAGVFAETGQGIQFFTNGSPTTPKAVITSAGNVGIGITSPAKKLDVYEGSTGNVEQYLRNTTINLLSKIDGTTSAQFGTETSHPLVLLTGNSERARIDSSGRLLVGTSSSTSATINGLVGKTQIASSENAALALHGHSSIAPYGADIVFTRSRSATIGTNTIVQNGDEFGRIYFAGANGTGFDHGASIQAVVDGTPGVGDMPGRLVFSTTADGASSSTERMRIDNNGRSRIYSSGPYTLNVRTGAAAGAGDYVLWASSAVTAMMDGGNTVFAVYTNGNVQNTNNAYGSLSDIKLKENIVDANSQWDDLKALQVRNYNFKEGQTHTQIGLVAQEVELVSPGLVSESPDRDEEGNDLGTVTKSVNYSVLYMKAVKALQEAIAKIETLEGMVAVNNITIDEQQHQLSTLAARLTALESA
jgi:hypothetical protein